MPSPSLTTLRQEAARHEQAGETAAALACYQQLLAAAPQDPELLGLAGLALCRQGNPAAGAPLLQSSLDQQPAQPVVWCNLATAYYTLNRFNDSLAAAEQAITFAPHSAPVLGAKARALVRLNRLEEALSTFQRAWEAAPAQADYGIGVALLLTQLGRNESALGAYDRVLALQPGNLMLWHRRGLARLDLGQLEAALADFDQALSLPGGKFLPDLHLGRGLALAELDQLEAARACCDQALALQPRHPGAFNNRALIAKQEGRFDEAWADYDRALALDPQFADAWCNKASLELRQGLYPAGWKNYEWRWQRRPAPALPGQPWRGDFSVAGKTLLLYAEQGYGDTLQFCRYAPLVAALGARVILQVPRALVSLLQTLPGHPEVIADQAPLPVFDAHCPLLSLPLAMGTQLETIPATIPYLFADPARMQYWARRLAAEEGPTLPPSALHIGLVWAGGARPDQPEAWAVNRRRNLPLAQWAPLAQSLNRRPLRFIGLQKGEAAEAEWDQPQVLSWLGPWARNLGTELTDFADTAALVMNLDLIITVDTALAHLAGALGKPVWILNRYDHCWRWLSGEGDSPWYPTARLFRQSHSGDWTGVVAAVAQSLGTFDPPPQAPEVASQE